MIPGFEAIVEERIKKAQEEGQFDRLDGQFKPLKFEPYNGPEELRMAHKILKNAGFLPPEVELRKKIHQTKQLLDAVQTEPEKKNTAQKRLRYLIGKLETLRQGQSGLSMHFDAYGRSIEKKLL
jgi:hypothetical protein